MTDINMQLVRECFELNLFHVSTPWQHDHLVDFSGELESLLFVAPIYPQEPVPLPFALRAEDIPLLPHAILEIRAWHGDRFYPSEIKANPVLAHLAESSIHDLGKILFQNRSFATVLIISELPATPIQRNRSLNLMRKSGISHVLEFPVLLQSMLAQVLPHGNYVSSPTLQTMRLLKRYQFIRNQQLEFPFQAEEPAAGSAVQAELI